jgi:low affinity Fe/Cu permease
MPNEKAPAEKGGKKMRDWFVGFSKVTSAVVGSVWAFVTAIVVIVIWAACGPVFKYSDTWQLIINTSTTIVTFLMVFLIQSTQNRDAKAIHLKLDELIRAQKGARNKFVDLESLSEEELEEFAGQFERFRKKACAEKSRRTSAANLEIEEIEDEADETIVVPEPQEAKSRSVRSARNFKRAASPPGTSRTPQS